MRKAPMKYLKNTTDLIILEETNINILFTWWFKSITKYFSTFKEREKTYFFDFV